MATQTTDNDTTVIKLSDYPIKFDSTALPFPTGWQQTFNKVQSSLQSEGGDDLIQSVRKDKLSVSAQFAVADDTWVKFFKQYDNKDSFTLSQYSPLTSTYEERTVRMENFSYQHRRKSELLTAVTAVWDVSFTLEEF